LLRTLNSPKSPRRGAVLAGLAGLLLLGACACPVRADEGSSVPENLARNLAAEVRREGPDGGLGAWSREIVERALERAGKAASGIAAGVDAGVDAGEGAGGRTSPAPLPAERHSAAFAGSRSNTAEILIFTSLSVPAASWRQWARDAARLGAPLVLRGVGEDGLRATAKRIGDRLGGHDAGVAIDPRLFRLFGIRRVPAVVVAPGGVPPCRSRGCADPGSGGAGPGPRAGGAGDPAPPHDLVTGNIGLAAALEAVAAEGDAGREVAKAHLGRMNGDRR